MKKLLKIAKTQAKNAPPSLALALVITLFVTLSANVLYQEKTILKRGFEIKLSADGKVIKKEVKFIPFAKLMKMADVKHGKKIFKKCASCHNIKAGAKAKVGPNLNGIIGKSRAVFPGFSYSKALKAKGGSWSRESVNEFITKPKKYLPGTKMSFSGLRKPQDRADLILFLESQ